MHVLLSQLSRRRIALATILLLGVTLGCGPATREAPEEETTAGAPGDKPGDAAPAWPEPDPADVESVDAIIAALYETISGSAGEARDWDRFRSLFHEDARLMPVGRSPERPEAAPVLAMTVDDYIQRSSRMLEQVSFYETEIGRTEAGFRNMVQVMSAYESRRDPDEDAFQTGVNGIQLLDDGDRWLILNLFWQAADEDHPIPEELRGRR